MQPPRPRILVVDDDPRLLHIVQMYLAIEGFDVATAADGETALASIATRRPSAVVLDVMMAGLDGLQVCRWIKETPATAGIGVVLFTALSRDADLERARAVGADRFITKPFSLVGLAETLRGVVGTAPPAPELAEVGRGG